MIGSSECRTEVILSQTSFYNGDQCQVKLICDNEKCKDDVKSFKIKLKRKVFASGTKAGNEEKIKDSKYLYTQKDNPTKCPAGKKVEAVLEFKIPSDDPDLPPDGRQQRLLQNDFPISCNLTQSSNFKLYQV